MVVCSISRKDFKGTPLSCDKEVFYNVVLGFDVKSCKDQGLHGLSKLCHCCREYLTNTGIFVPAVL